MHLVGQVVVEGPDGGDFPGPGGGVQAVSGPGAVGVLDPVPSQIRHVAVDVRQGHRAHEVQIHIGDIDLVQSFSSQRWVAGLLEISEEIPQVQIVLIGRPAGMGFDGLMVRQEVPQDLRCLSAVIRHKRF